MTWILVGLKVGATLAVGLAAFGLILVVAVMAAVFIAVRVAEWVL